VTELVLAVDDEQLVVEFLLGQADIAAIVADAVATDLPAGWSAPRIRVNRLGGIGDRPGWLDHPRIQIECFGATKAQAKDLVLATRAAVTQQLVGVHDLGVVTSVDEYLGPQWLPDVVGDQRTPATPRYLFSVQLTTHPNH
jgi:hypothetical protein